MSRTVGLIGLLAASAASGCTLLGPSCLARQQSGAVASISGDIAAGQIVVHEVRYDVQGSQNDVAFRWDDLEGVRLGLWATRPGCTAFRPPRAGEIPSALNTGECAPLGSAGSQNGPYVSELHVTHGRGNPDTLGPSAQYKLWVIGDAARSAHYTIETRWFYGPDC